MLGVKTVVARLKNVIGNENAKQRESIPRTRYHNNYYFIFAFRETSSMETYGKRNKKFLPKVPRKRIIDRIKITNLKNH